jgi:hypothetical protein
MTRLIRRRKGKSESEDKRVLSALDLASLIACSTNKDGANTYQRRKAQNRASQRAFRERKRSHTEDLQQQVDKLHKTNEHLLEMHNQDVDKLSNMKTHADQLKFEITMVQIQSNLQQGWFDGTESTGAWEETKLEETPSYFEPWSGATDFNTSLDFAADRSDMEAALVKYSASSPSTWATSTETEAIHSQGQRLEIVWD